MCIDWLPICKIKSDNIYIYIYIYIYILYIYICVCVCVCVCVWLGSSCSFKHVSLNNKDKFCLYHLFKILSSFLISVLFQVRIDRWISPNCPECFCILHRPSSGVACVRCVCIVLKKRVLKIFESLYHNENIRMQSWIKQGNRCIQKRNAI